MVERFQDPPVAQARWAWIWLIPRLYAGWVCLQAGWEKLHDPAWTGAKADTALSGFVTHALTETSGAHPNAQGWDGWFLQHLVSSYTAVWGRVASWGAFLVDVALILGIFTAIAAFFGAFMNMNYLLAGTVGTNPIQLVTAVLLLLAWKTAGWWGLDRWILPALGEPRRPGAIFHPDSRESVGRRQRTRVEHDFLASLTRSAGTDAGSEPASCRLSRQI